MKCILTKVNIFTAMISSVVFWFLPLVFVTCNNMTILQVLPYFVMDIFDSTPGMPGVFLAALFSASLRYFI